MEFRFGEKHKQGLTSARHLGKWAQYLFICLENCPAGIRLKR
jgi:hypothetical protein